MSVSTCSETAFERPNVGCQRLEVRAEVGEVEGVLFAELIVRLVENTVTGNFLVNGVFERPNDVKTYFVSNKPTAISGIYAALVKHGRTI